MTSTPATGRPLHLADILEAVADAVPSGSPPPVGYSKDPVKTAATFKEVDGVRWSLPATSRGARRTVP